jgi:hypothetical protein
MWDHEILYTDICSDDEQLLIRPFLPKAKKRMCQVVEFKIYVLFCADNSYTKQSKFGTVKDHEHTYKFYLNHCFL